MSNSNKEQSPLVESVLALDTYFSELNRLSAKIEETDMKTDFDLEQMQKLMTHFAECGQNVSREVVAMSQALQEARAKAEASAALVSQRAEELHSIQSDRQKKMDAFRSLGEKVHTLTASLNELKKPEGETITEEDKAKIASRLSEFEAELNPLIDEAQSLKEEAQSSRMKFLEQGADSLRQSLLAVRQKLNSYQQAQNAQHYLQ